MFYRQHHAVEAPAVDERQFRTSWRVRTKLDKLFDDGAIAIDEWRAGLAFRATAEQATRTALLTSSWNSIATGKYCRPPAREMTEAQPDAVARLRQVSARLGRFTFALLTACLIHDAS